MPPPDKQLSAEQSRQMLRHGVQRTEDARRHGDVTPQRHSEDHISVDQIDNHGHDRGEYKTTVIHDALLLS